MVGGSFIASNISSEHFIGMIGRGVHLRPVRGRLAGQRQLVLVPDLAVHSFLLASKVFTIPEFSSGINGTLRQFFAFVTVLSNVVASWLPCLRGRLGR